MNAPALYSVPLAARREVEQLVLRPVIVFAEVVAREPPSVVVDRRRPPQRCAAPGPSALFPLAACAWEYPSGLETYRAPRRPRRAPRIRPKRATPTQVPPASAPTAPVRPAGLQVWAPRKQRAGARPHSLGKRRLTEAERQQLQRDEAWLRRRGILQARPRTLGECQAEPGPCPYVGCSAHLYLEVNEATGAIKLNFPDKEVWELEETCAHRVADRGGATLDEVGKLVNLTQERISQIERIGLAKMEEAKELADAAGS